jgi:hypothetical protein
MRIGHSAAVSEVKERVPYCTVLYCTPVLCMSELCVLCGAVPVLCLTSEAGGTDEVAQTDFSPLKVRLSSARHGLATDGSFQISDFASLGNRRTF